MVSCEERKGQSRLSEMKLRWAWNETWVWGAAERGPGKVERGRQCGSAKAECGYRWSHRKKVGGTHTKRHI